MGGCSVPGCRNSSAKGYNMHAFPVDPQRRALWVKQIGREEDFNPGRSTAICSEHFAPEMLKETSKGKFRLVDGACPTIFPDPGPKLASKRNCKSAYSKIKNFRSMSDAPKFQQLLARLRLVYLDMEDPYWHLFLSKKFTLFFGQSKVPLSGILIPFNSRTGEYHITVFSQTYRSGRFKDVKELFQTLEDLFGSKRQLPCIGSNNFSNSEFSTRQFAQDCSKICDDIRAQPGKKQVAGRCHYCLPQSSSWDEEPDGFVVTESCDTEKKQADDILEQNLDALPSTETNDETGDQPKVIVMQSFQPVFSQPLPQTQWGSQPDLPVKEIDSGEPEPKRIKLVTNAEKILEPETQQQLIVPPLEVLSPNLEACQTQVKNEIEAGFPKLAENQDYFMIASEEAAAEELKCEVLDLLDADPLPFLPTEDVEMCEEMLEPEPVHSDQEDKEDVSSSKIDISDKSTMKLNEEKGTKLKSTAKKRNLKGRRKENAENVIYSVKIEYLEIVKSRICDLCPEPRKFTNLTKICRHLRKDHGIKDLHQCAECSRVFGLYSSLTRHKQLEHFYGQFICALCPASEGKRQQKVVVKSAHGLVEHIHKEHPACPHGGYKVHCPCCREQLTFLDIVSLQDDFPKHYKECVYQKSYKTGAMTRKRHLQKIKAGEVDGYLCHLCDKKFYTTYNLRMHVLSVHKTEEPKFQCDQCSYRAYLKKTLQTHMLQKHGVGVTTEDIVCQLCGVCFSTDRAYQVHRLKVHRVEILKENYGCDECQMGFDDIDQFKNHMSQKHNVPDASHEYCDKCGKITSTMFSNKALHMVFEHGETEDLLACNMKNGTKRPNFVRAKRNLSASKTGKGPQQNEMPQNSVCKGLKVEGGFACVECDHVVGSYAGLFHHFATKHRPDKRKKCPHCDYMGVGQSLTRHLQKHEEAKLKCPRCDKLFKKKLALEAHLRMHDNIRAFKCELCDKSYTSSMGLYQHNRYVHLGVRYDYSKKKKSDTEIVEPQ